MTEVDFQKRARKYLLEAKLSNRYFTVAEYERFSAEKLNIEPAKDSTGNKYTGLRATDICADRGIQKGEIAGQDFNVGTYPEKVLAEVVFGHLFRDIFPDYPEYLIERYPTAPGKYD